MGSTVHCSSLCHFSAFYSRLPRLGSTSLQSIDNCNRATAPTRCQSPSFQSPFPSNLKSCSTVCSVQIERHHPSTDHWLLTKVTDKAAQFIMCCIFIRGRPRGECGGVIFCEPNDDWEVTLTNMQDWSALNQVLETENFDSSRVGVWLTDWLTWKSNTRVEVKEKMQWIQWRITVECSGCSMFLQTYRRQSGIDSNIRWPPDTSEMVSEVIYGFFFLNAPTCCSLWVLLEALKFMGSWTDFKTNQIIDLRGNERAGAINWLSRY